MPNWTGSVGIDPSFLEMMPDTIIFNATTATDKYGKKTFGGGNISVRARVIDDVVLVKNEEGQDVVSVGRAILYGDYSSLTLGHKLTLPDGRSPVIVKIDSPHDTSATPHHTVVYFGM